MSSRGSSSRIDSSEQRVDVFGVPKRCWCGHSIVALTSSSENNPYRRYLRCAYVVKYKLVNDKHTFKWNDEASLEELETLSNRIDRLEDAFSKGMDLQLEMREEMRLEAKFESKKALKLSLLVVLVVVIVIIVMFVAIKLLH